VGGREPRGTYLNPHGLACAIVTLARAGNLSLSDHASTENTWFEGYAWRPASCARCDLFLGWRFEARQGGEPARFYGLLEARLTAEE